MTPKDEQLLNRQAAKIMEPIYRMVKVVEQKNELDARTLMAVCVQYITDHSVGKCLREADVQEIVRAALLHHKEGLYYSDYIYNELQVKIASWMTLMAIDRPVTLGDLGETADKVAEALVDENALALTAEQVMDVVKAQVGSIDEVVYERLLLNEANFLNELRMILFQ